MKKLFEMPFDLREVKGDARARMADALGKSGGAFRLAFDDGGRVKYAAEIQLEDGSVVVYSRADCSEIADLSEVIESMSGVVETRKTERAK